MQEYDPDIKLHCSKRTKSHRTQVNIRPEINLFPIVATRCTSGGMLIFTVKTKTDFFI